jgi:fatty-acyl-CoA synthase
MHGTPHQGRFQPHLLIHGLSYDLQRPLLVLEDGSVVTAGQFRDRISQFVQTLARHGLAKGDRVAVLAPNRPEVLCVTAACLIGQHVLVPLHPAGAVDDLAYAVEESEVKVLVFDPQKFTDTAARIRERVPECVLLALGPSALGDDLCAQAASVQPTALVAPDVAPDEPYRLTYSGGTTGKPKAVVATHRVGAAVVAIQMAEWEWPSQIRQLVCSPLSHAGSAMFLPTLLRGGQMVLMGTFEPVAVMQAIEKHRITCVLLVPTMIYSLLDHPRWSEFDLTSLETIFYGAAAISPARLREGIERLGPVFFQFYGQVEAPMSIAVLRRADHDITKPLRLASCGRPVPWVEVALLDDKLCEVPPETPGEICVRGPLVMAGYLNQPDLTSEALRGGWLHTGDVAVKDADGFIRIVGRLKDMIITGGFNVYPREIEDVLSNHPDIASCAVIGVPDAHWGEAVTAIVVLRPGAATGPDEIKAYVRARKGPVYAPKSVEFVQAIPLTGLGKPDKKLLRKQYSSSGKMTVSPS